MAEEKVTETKTVDTGKEPEVVLPEPSQDKYTDKEKAEYNLKKKAEEAKALGLDPAEVLGVKMTVSDIKIDGAVPDDKPLTVKELRELQKREAHETALSLAKHLPDTERDEVTKLLETRIVPSGNAEEDLRLARAAVNAEHNAKIAEEIGRRPDVRRTAAGGSASATVEEQFVPTEEEKQFMAPPYNLSKEKILAARAKQNTSQAITS